MATEPSTIDLGLISPEAGTWPAVDARWRGWSRRRAWAAGRAWHWWPAAVLAATLVLTTSAAAAHRPWLEPVFTIPVNQRVQFGGQNLYAVALDGDRGTQVLTAYRLADGTVRWRVPVGAGNQAFVLWGGTPMLVGDPPGARSGASPTVAVLDPETGQPRWRHRGSPASPLAEGRILLRREEPDTGLTYGPTFDLVLVDGATGEVIWRIPDIWEESRWQLSADDTHLLVHTFGGTLTSYDLATGAAVATRRVAPPCRYRVPPGTDGPAVPDPVPTCVDVHPAGAMVLLREWSVTGTVLFGYDQRTLTHRWTVPDLPETVRSWSCGKLECLSDQGVLRALDPATGESRWAVPPSGTDRDQVIVSGSARFPDHLVLERQSGSVPARDRWLLDADTGRPVLDLRDWELRGSRWGTPFPDGVLARRDGAVWFGRPRDDLSGVDVIGVVPEAIHGCVPGDRHVACQLSPPTGPPVIQVFRVGG